MIKIGVIGYGYWGPNLVRNFMSAPGSVVTRVCDLREERLSSLEKIYPGLKTCTDATELINDPQIDAVVIATPVSSQNEEFQPALERGYHFWKTSFFLAEGWPKYYDDDPYPVDTHAAASAIVTFLECRDLDPDAARLAQNVANWTIANLRDSRGYFYYQKRRFYTVRKPYMRWTQAWMLYALSRLLEDVNI